MLRESQPLADNLVLFLITDRAPAPVSTLNFDGPEVISLSHWLQGLKPPVSAEKKNWKADDILWQLIQKIII